MIVGPWAVEGHMRILVDLGSHVTGSPQIVQVDRTPTPGVAGATNINGKYVIPVIKGVEFPVDAASYVLGLASDVDGGDVSSTSYAHLLAMYPLFGNVYFNPLLTGDQVEELDLSATFRDTFTNPPNVYLYTPRMQTGRSLASPAPFVGPEGQMPTHTAILPMNITTTPARPGLAITKLIDLTSYAADGTDNFMIYWKLMGFGVTQDVAHGSTNEPSIRTVIEPDQEPDDFTVYLSPDDGVTWCQVGLLEPIGFCYKTKGIRVAFVNRSPDKVFLATYAVLF